MSKKPLMGDNNETELWNMIYNKKSNSNNYTSEIQCRVNKESTITSHRSRV